MAVSLTTTVNLPFGSQVLDPETGIILNDEVRITYGARREPPLNRSIADGRFLHTRNSECVWLVAIPS